MSKWIVVDEIERAVPEVAAAVLQLRMRHIQQLLPLAAHEYRADVEYVHQLRVGCRRAGAAVQAFRPLLTPKQIKPLRKRLRKLRRAAGPARDVDVLQARIAAEPASQPGHDYIIARLQRQRLNAQQSLLDVANPTGFARLEASVERCLTELAEQSTQGKSPCFSVYGREALRRISQKMFRLAELEQPTVAQLHQLRIAGKRLRYSIEIFHCLFPRALREDVYPLVQEIQSRLGRLNDYASAQRLFQQWLADLPPNERAAQLATRIVDARASTVKMRKEFLQWWTAERVADLESHLSELIHVRR